MKTITGIEKILSFHPEWRPFNIKFLTSLSWNPPQMSATFLSVKDVKKEVANGEDDFIVITLMFHSVSGIILKLSGGFIHQLIGFDISDISGNGWENKKFQIEDYENGTIKFYCNDIEVLDVSTTEPPDF